MTITCMARQENLPTLIDFVEQACRRCGADDVATFALRLAVEEVCMNLVLHGYRNATAGPITLGFVCEGGEMTVTVRDRGAPFSPDDALPPDLTPDWQQRRPGGLGWHLIRSMMDRLHYEADAEHGNCLTLVKKLSTPVHP